MRHFDTDIGLCDDGLYSIGTGKDPWHDVTPDELRIMLEGASPPKFRTALAKTGEDSFAGPWYIDIDCDDIGEAIDALRSLLDNLEGLGLNLASVRLFASGGKGFHLEIPAACLMPAQEPVQGLPRIYKAMTYDVFVDGVDTRVYSSRRGRLWRVPNVERESGAYKVPVTIDEARAMTSQSYAELCSAPRAFPSLAAPALCAGLAATFMKARDTVASKATRGRKWSKTENELRCRFSGNCPPSVAAVLKGEVQSPVGFNTLALQVCLLAHGLQWGEERLVSECAGLIANHDGDGHRYNSPRKREHELRRMFEYVEGNATYSFSVAGLRSILPTGSRSPDLQGLEADESEDAPDYAELLNAADGDAGEVVSIARRLSADQSLSRTEAENLIKRAARSAGVPAKVLKADLWQPDEDSDPRAVIHVRRNDFAGSVDSCLAVLPSIPGLRVRSGALVEVVRSGAGSTIVSVTAARLAYLVSQRARWNYGDSFGGPDIAVLQALMAAGHWPGVPEVVSLLHQPTIDREGEIITGGENQSGMDVSFRAAGFPAYAGSGFDALNELRDLLREFPFASALDESASLAAILTAVARPMLSTTPGFLISAHDLGTGKSYLAELIALFAGEDVTMRRWAQRAEEQDKSLLAVLLEGRPSCVFDNLVHHWQSPTLAAILTGPTYSDRVLGASASVNVSTRCLFVATGNNIKPVKDLSRRVVTIELDARCENPLLRAFKGDPVGAVRANRGRWVMCALHVLQAYLRDGCSGAPPSVASFNEWSRLVRGALVHVGLPDPVRALVRNVGTDDDRDLLGHMLVVWGECFGDEPLTLREVLRATATAAAGSSLADLRHLLLEVAEERGEINARRLGKWVASYAGRVVGGLRFAPGEKGRAGVPWSVVKG